MATLSGSTITTDLGGKLTGVGNALIYCGSLCCEASGNIKSFDLGTVPAGTYTIEKISTGRCVVKFGGVQGTFASFNGQRFRNPADGGEYIYGESGLSLSLVEKEDLAPNQPYDCINGNCLPAKTYNTPGMYSSRSACQSNCNKGSTCLGECVPPEQIAALKQAASKALGRLCR